MKRLYFDIETIPATAPGVRDEFIASVTAPGQYKKPESIAEWLRDNREAEGEKAWLATSFDGGLGHVCCIGFAIGDDQPSVYTTESMDERECLGLFFEAVADAGACTFVGHNIIGFDLPFLWKRAMVLGVKPPWTFPRAPKKWSESVIDTMLLWDDQQRAGGSMDRICKLMGIPGKGDMDGSKVWAAVRDGRIAEVADYCAQDVVRTRLMLKRMLFEG